MVLAELRLRCNGEKQYRVKVLKEIIEEMTSVWSSSLRSVIAWISGSLRIRLCGHVADVGAELLLAREEAEVDVDQLFDPVLPRCKEPISEVATA